MEMISAAAAVERIPAGGRVVLPHGCVEPHAIHEALARSPGRPDDPPSIFTGLQFGPHRFLGVSDAAGERSAGVLGPGYRLVTWQVGPALRPVMGAANVDLLPARFRDLPRLFGRSGPLRPDVVFVQCTPPRHGRVNLGISCSLFPTLIDAARLVVAELHPDLPAVAGETEIDAARISLAVDGGGPLGTLARSAPDDVDRAILERVLELIPEGACVQLGVGALPDALLGRLAEVRDIRLHSGMLSDPLADFLDRAPSGTTVTAGELAASVETYRRAAQDPRVRLLPTTTIHDVPYLSQLPRFVSVNSAIEVDLAGQVNGEAIDGRQISGVGGSLDFVEGARCSAGGLSIIALRSTARGRSRIVPCLREGTPVTIPRFAADVVVTEHGAARLFGLGLRARAEALIGIADPSFRDQLDDRARSAVRD